MPGQGGMLEAAAAAMEEKLERVTSWLKKKYGNEPIPEYEVNEETVDILCNLVERTEAREKDLSLLIEDMKQMAAEYEARTKYLQSVLVESLNLSPASLSSETESDLNTLVDSAMELDTKDTSLASLFAAINDMSAELCTLKPKNREMEWELTQMKEKLAKALVLEARLKEDIKKIDEELELEKHNEEQKRQKLEFMTNKAEELKIQIKASEEQLTATGLDQSLTHEALVTLSQKVAQMEEEMVPLKKELEAYSDLAPALNMVDIARCAEVGALNKILTNMKKYPRNPTLAQVKIEEVKRELETLEKEFSECIEGMTFEIPMPCRFKRT